MFRQASEALLIYDLDSGCFVDANPAALRLFECGHGELLQAGPHAFHLGEGAWIAPTTTYSPEIEATDLPTAQEVVLRTGLGRQRWCELRHTQVKWAGRSWGQACYVDITDRRECQIELQVGQARVREVEGQYKLLFEQVQEAVLLVDSRGVVTAVNRAATEMFGYSPEDFPGQHIATLLAEAEQFRNRYLRVQWKRVVGSILENCEAQGLHRAGHSFPIQVKVLGTEQLGRPESLWLVRDLSGEREVERQIEHLAYCDALTGLPNRRRLLDHLAQTQRGLPHGSGHAALICVDIDQFTNLNDTLGYAAGDALLRMAGSRLTELLGEKGLVARLGADEFGILLRDLGNEPQEARKSAMSWCQAILHLTRRQHGLLGQEYKTSASLGVVLIRDGRDEPEALLAQADLAMRKAKIESRDTYRFYDPAMGRLAATRAALLNDLRLALPRQELLLMYQPQLDAAGRVLGAEILLRWRHPTRGMVMPAEFIPLAEQSGFIVEIGQWVLQQACQTLARWAVSPLEDGPTISVNVSATEFRDPDFVASVVKGLEASQVDPRRLKLELTESVLAVDLAELASKLQELKHLGVGLSLDDFGTGYSSMAYLRELPLDELKIDRSFIVEIDRSPRDETIVRGLIELSRVLGLSIVAEGVETESQKQRLLACGCPCFQGYLTGRPIEENALLALTACAQAATEKFEAPKNL